MRQRTRDSLQIRGRHLKCRPEKRKHLRFFMISVQQEQAQKKKLKVNYVCYGNTGYVVTNHYRERAGGIFSMVTF